MREPSESKRKAVLTLAYELGVRAFDVAPTYGLGRAEEELGWLLAQADDDTVKVTTKFGRSLAKSRNLLSRVQAPARRVARAVPAVRPILQRLARGNGEQATVMTSPVIREELYRSLDRLGVTRVTRNLAHVVMPEDGFLESWEGLRAEAAEIGAGVVGLSGPAELLRRYPQSVLESTGVLQLPFGDFAERVATHSKSRQVVRYSVLSALKSRLEGLAISSEDASMRWNAPILSNVRKNGRLMLALAACRRAAPEEELIVGVSSAVHLHELADALARWRNEEGVQWTRLRSDLGLPMEAQGESSE